MCRVAVLALLLAAPAAPAADLADILLNDRLAQARAIVAGDMSTLRSALRTADAGSARDPGWHFRRGVAAWMFNDRKAALDAFDEGLARATAPVRQLSPRESADLFKERARVFDDLDAAVFPVPGRRTGGPDKFRRFTTGVLEANALPGIRKDVAAEAARAGAPRAGWMAAAADGFVARGVLYLEQKEIPKAARDLRAAVQYNPASGRGHTFLGLAQAAWGDYPKALDALVRAAGCPDDTYAAVPLSLAAYVVATCPDAEIRHKHRADAAVWAEHGLKGATADLLHLPPFGRVRHVVLARMARAAALAETGGFEAAVKLLANTPVGTEEDDRVRRRVADQLTAYRAGKAYREFKGMIAVPTVTTAR